MSTCDCQCGSNCSCSGCGCNRNPSLGFSEKINTTVSVITGFAPMKTVYEGSEMSYGSAENDGCGSASCKCGSDCKCGADCAC